VMARSILRSFPYMKMFTGYKMPDGIRLTLQCLAATMRSD
jgi:hypothetical protein